MNKTKKSLLFIGIAIAILCLSIVSAGCTGSSSSGTNGQSGDYQLLQSIGKPAEIFEGAWDGELTEELSKCNRVYNYTLDFVRDSDNGGHVNVKYTVKDVDKKTGNTIQSYDEQKFDNWCNWEVDENNMAKANAYSNDGKHTLQWTYERTYDGKYLFVGSSKIPYGTLGESKKYANDTIGSKYFTPKSSKKPISNYQEVIIGTWYDTTPYVGENSELGEYYNEFTFYPSGNMQWIVYSLTNNKEVMNETNGLSWKQDDNGYSFYTESDEGTYVGQLTVLDDNTMAMSNGHQLTRDKTKSAANSPVVTDVIGIWKGTKVLSEYDDTDPRTNTAGKTTLYNSYSLVFKNNGYIDVYERTESSFEGNGTPSIASVQSENNKSDCLKWEYLNSGNCKITSVDGNSVGTFNLSDKNTGELVFTDTELSNNYFKSATLKKYSDTTTNTNTDNIAEKKATTFGSVARNQ